MNVEAILPVNVTADQPGQTKTRQIVVTDVVEVEPQSVEIAVTVTAEGNTPVTTPLTVNFEPGETGPAIAIDVPPSAGVDVTVANFSKNVLHTGTVYTAEMTITTT